MVNARCTVPSHWTTIVPEEGREHVPDVVALFEEHEPHTIPAAPVHKDAKKVIQQGRALQSDHLPQLQNVVDAFFAWATGTSVINVKRQEHIPAAEDSLASTAISLCPTLGKQP